MAVLSRANLVHDVGYIDSGMTSSMEMLAICDEIIAMVGVLFRGIPIDSHHLALGVMEEVVAGGSFLAAEHTARFFRANHFLPRLLVRGNYETWRVGGCTTLEDRANAYVLDILASHRPEELPAGALAAVASILGE
jgi:trimethylamine--corrinoid protein Co-methyltransferase